MSHKAFKSELKLPNYIFYVLVSGQNIYRIKYEKNEASVTMLHQIIFHLEDGDAKHFLSDFMHTKSVSFRCQGKIVNFLC